LTCDANSKNGDLSKGCCELPKQSDLRSRSIIAIIEERTTGKSKQLNLSTRIYLFVYREEA